MTAKLSCKVCNALSHPDHLVEGECIPCTRGTVRRLKRRMRALMLSEFEELSEDHE